MDRRTLRSGVARVALVAAFAIAGPGCASAQSAAKPDASPLAPGDLKAPIFDTRTPVYNLAGETEKSAGSVVAEVDGRAITLGDVSDAIAELPPAVRDLPFADLFPGVVDQLVRQQALAIRAQRQGLDEDSAIRRRIKAVSDRMLGDELLKREASAGITEAALLERYTKDIAGKPGPDEAHVRVIMVQTEQEATAIIAELRAGGDFATLAKRSSKDPTAIAGGDVGFVTIGQLTPEIGAVVFAMLSGQSTPMPVHTLGAWYVLKVEERRRGSARPFSVGREELRQAMIKERVPDLIKAALAGVTVRLYNINGKESDATTSGAGARKTD
jgi:peptidyl-prolyl cis-trans isomerase C